MDAIALRIKRIRKWKTIYIVVAIALILFNLLSAFVQLRRGGYRYMPEGTAERIGYYIGSYIFVLFGLFLFLRVYNMQKRIRLLEQQQLEKSIDKIGDETDAGE
jgi:hypothetical protein